MNSSPENNNSVSSLDADPKAVARRRAVVVVENMLKAGRLPEGGVNGVDNGNGVYSGNDLSHKIMGETVLGRSRDFSHLKKGVLATSFPTKRRKSVHRQAKPTWQTFLSCLTKNLLLLAALVYLGQVIWRWTAGYGRDASSPFAALDFDGRILEVESSLKKTEKMLQVQLEVVEKKLESGIGIVTRELIKQIEEKGTLLEKEMKNLKVRTDELGDSLSQLKDTGLLSKEELEKFWNELKTRSLDGAGKHVDLDKIRAVAREIVEKEIEKHAADGLGRVDYALASGGAKVVKHSEPYVVGKVNSWLAVGKVKNSVHPSAQKMLEPSFGEPGQCFPLQGSEGFIEIRLRTGIIPEAVTVEHVSKSVAYDRSSAPKDCLVSGWFEGPADAPSTRDEKISLLTEFSYDLEKSNVQTFTIPMADVSIINMVKLDFTSNHGSSALTCIYRFRVHGYEPTSPVDLAMQP